MHPPLPAPPSLDRDPFGEAPAAAGRRPEIDGQAGLRDLAAAFAMLESDMTRREVAVEDVLAGAIEAYQRPINQVLGI